jgi:hypothetical protein
LNSFEFELYSNRVACQSPTAALPRLPLNPSHPTADTGPHCRPAPPVSRAALPAPAALHCLPARLHRERALSPLTAPPGAIPAPRSLLCSPCAPAELKKPLAPHSAPRPRLSSSSPPSPPPTRLPRRLPLDVGHGRWPSGRKTTRRP